MKALRKLFRSKKNEVWQQLAEEVGGEHVAGTWKTGSKVQVYVDEWTVTLDTYAVSTGQSTVIYTRMRAPYVNADGFRFTVYRKSLFSGLGKLFGMQDIVTGFRDFDDAFIIKGNDAKKVRELFSNERIRTLLEAQSNVHLEVKDDEGFFGAKFPDGVDELCFHVAGIITDIDRLKALFDLFAEVLHHLCHMASAYEDDPQLAL